MSKIFLLKGTHAPNTAASNRFMAMLKTFSDEGVDVEVVFFMSDSNNHEAPALPHVHYQYLWKHFNPKNDKLKTLLYIYVYSKLFLRKLKEGDIVYSYGCNEMLSATLKKKGVKVYHERTEHPMVSKLKLLNMRQYLEACTHVDGLFVISNSLKEYFTSIGVPKEKIHIINMTVEASRFDGLVCRPKERYIAYCGKATNNKDGVDELIKAFAITAKTHPDVKLYIIGAPPKRSDESGNLELVERLGIASQVVFTGLVSANEIPQMLKDAEILALDRPDNMQAKYGFPTKLGEYLLTANPVAITRVGDIPMFLKDGVTALLAEPNSPKQFAEKLNWALDNREEALKIGAAGKELALENFDSVIETKKMIKIILKNR